MADTGTRADYRGDLGVGSGLIGRHDPLLPNYFTTASQNLQRSFKTRSRRPAYKRIVGG
jgi:hypothetical protein